MRIQVKDFMSSPVTTVIGGDTAGDVRALLQDKGIHSVPVVLHSKKLPINEVIIRGIVTASDLTDEVEDSTPIEKVMTQNVHVAHKDASAKSAANMMIKHGVHHIVVMDDGEIVGIISSLDFVKLVSAHSLE